MRLFVPDEPDTVENNIQYLSLIHISNVPPLPRGAKNTPLRGATIPPFSKKESKRPWACPPQKCMVF